MELGWLLGDALIDGGIEGLLEGCELGWLLGDSLIDGDEEGLELG